MTLINVKSRPAEKSFNNFIDDFFPQLPSILRDDFVAPFSKQFTPVNVKQNDNGYIVEVVAPGFSKEDFKIALDNYKLTVSAEKKSEVNNGSEKHIRNEYKFQSFKRSFTIDEKTDVENISAKYENGVLTLNLPLKGEVKEVAKEISIQ
jgi:Molecular chaperone (small heat shock protein)